MHETYIVAQTRHSMVIVDQHAAHERLVYERMKAALATAASTRQGLLIPAIVELDDDEAVALDETVRRTGGAGPRTGAFGPGAVPCARCPLCSGDTDVNGLVRDLARETVNETVRPQERGSR